MDYQRQSFRTLSHDGQYCFWAFGRRKLKDGSIFIEPSQNDDDLDSIPLYEQIYALAGMAQFYRISLDYEVLEDLRRTVNAFHDFYLDDRSTTRISRRCGGPRPRGYFSHLDYATMRPDTDHLGQNRLRKNWNSIGDHIPAYLVNLLAALDPLPRGREPGRRPPVARPVPVDDQGDLRADLRPFPRPRSERPLRQRAVPRRLDGRPRVGLAEEPGDRAATT